MLMVELNAIFLSKIFFSSGNTRKTKNLRTHKINSIILRLTVLFHLENNMQ